MMLTSRRAASAALWGLVAAALVLPRVAQAQAVTVTPTYQTSVHMFDPSLPGSELRGWGVMLGFERPGRWLEPHVWVQRYQMGSSAPTDTEIACGNEGWSVSLGPAIQLVRSGPVSGSFVPQIGIGPRTGRSRFDGSAGLHVDVDAGGFQPQFFGRLLTLGSETYGMIGLGVRFRFPYDLGGEGLR
jgi:hypothetical protein